MQIYETLFGNGYTMDYETCLFVAGLRSIQCIITRRVLGCARDELCNVIDLRTFFFYIIRTCFNSIGKRNGLVHMLDAVLAHQI